MLRDDLLTSVDIVPDDVSIEVAAGREKDSTLGLLGEFMRETNVLLRLRGTRQQKHVDYDAFSLAHLSLPECCSLRPWVGRIQEIEMLTFKMRGGQAVGDEDNLAVWRILRLQELSPQL